MSAVALSPAHREGTKIAVIKGALDAIYEKQGELTPAAVVEAAKNKASPLHDQFTWDNTKAATNYRLLQAAFLIKTVKIRVAQGEDSIRTNAYVLPKKGNGQFRAIQDVLSDGDLADAMMDNARSELSAFKAKYGRLERLSSLITEMEKVLAGQA